MLRPVAKDVNIFVAGLSFVVAFSGNIDGSPNVK